jgi:hypothetical protein
MQDLQALAREGDKPSLLEKLRRTVEVIEATLLPAPRFRAAPLRGVPPELQRFRAGGMDIHISVQPGRGQGTRAVMGRLLPQGEASLPIIGPEAWLMRGEEAWATPIETGDIFTFEEVQPGEYSLGLEWDGQVVVMREVKVM